MNNSDLEHNFWQRQAAAEYDASSTGINETSIGAGGIRPFALALPSINGPPWAVLLNEYIYGNPIDNFTDSLKMQFLLKICHFFAKNQNLGIVAMCWGILKN